MAAVEIHGYVRCPFAWRVRLAAAEKGVPADFVPCDVDDPDPRAAAHNPHEHSPLLWHDGFELRESEIIALYLDEAWDDGPTLLPSDPRQRAELRLLGTRLRALDAHMEASRPEARRRSQPAVRALGEALALGPGPYLHGARPGLTDLMAWPFLADLAARRLLDPTASRAAAYVAAMVARPSFAETAPPHLRVLAGERAT
jgi:glutathione S-transferase